MIVVHAEATGDGHGQLVTRNYREKLSIQGIDIRASIKISAYIQKAMHKHIWPQAKVINISVNKEERRSKTNI